MSERLVHRVEIHPDHFVALFAVGVLDGSLDRRDGLLLG
jgi:hypothetical protein